MSYLKVSNVGHKGSCGVLGDLFSLTAPTVLSWDVNRLFSFSFFLFHFKDVCYDVIVPVSEQPTIKCLFFEHLMI